MARFLIQASYTPESWAAQLKSPEDRTKLIAPLMESVGARLESLYYAFGPVDVVVIVEAPDNVTAAALALAVTASGAFRSFSTTPLLTVDEGIAAMRKAASAAAHYRAPGVAASG